MMLAPSARRRITMAVVAALLQGCVRLPSLVGRSTSLTIPETADTRLGRAVLPLVRAHADTTGVVALRDGRDAFAVRALLADAAERTIDAQYYVWHDDMTGTLLFDALRRAADRGVRVRLLLDDNNTRGLDPLLAALDAHPGIEVRLFNPAVHRGWRRYVDFLVDFGRMNRRMHNKSFTVDDQVTIVGGRNVGDEYFGAGDGALFSDLDVMAIGPIVNTVSRDFDRYWASESSFPADRIVAPAAPSVLSALDRDVAQVNGDSASQSYLRALADSRLVRALLANEVPFVWAPVTMLSDDPAKGLGRVPDDSLMWPQLRKALGRPNSEVDDV
jgi:Phosphatidylserine/phosphatidylglycerophosphate/cardiolipin synthases and related enzymes